ncbi:hypothetical protein GWR56_04860 [Mucilaginibacter sp. 14171R-50]|uniref:hypothetical protein n=1 Tax=Mucilaginibacter sp. 14171R-50 TaxID=2703789 RepID=UPI00138C34F8|nr:hypothetical protein [Mucilaginibacter sp. 14171R-50]QHS54909.1 hypothetical protein GWR56_04860 [Mucilaginibacter sp. 14171R-50]
MKTYNRPILKGTVLAAAIALCFSLNLHAGTINHSLPSLTAVSNTGKMQKMDKMKKKDMKKKKPAKMEKSKMEPSKMDGDKMGSKM